MGDASVESYLREGNDANVIAVTVTAQNTYKLISQTDGRYVVSYFNFMLMDSCGQCGGERGSSHTSWFITILVASGMECDRIRPIRKPF